MWLPIYHFWKITGKLVCQKEGVNQKENSTGLGKNDVDKESGGKRRMSFIQSLEN